MSSVGVRIWIVNYIFFITYLPLWWRVAARKGQGLTWMAGCILPLTKEEKILLCNMEQDIEQLLVLAEENRWCGIVVSEERGEISVTVQDGDIYPNLDANSFKRKHYQKFIKINK